MNITKLPRMAGFMILALLVYLVGVLVSRVFPGSILGILRDLGAIALAFSAAYYVYIGFRRAITRVFWKVRNKIIVSFAFIGIIPVVIMAGILVLVIVIILKTSSGLYLARELEGISDSLREMGTAIATDYYRARERPGPYDLGVRITDRLKDLPSGLKKIRVGVCETVYNPLSGDSSFVIRTIVTEESQTGSLAVSLPQWLKSEFEEFTVQNDSVDFTFVQDLDDRIRLIIQLPLDSSVVEYIRRRTAIEMEVAHLDPEDNPTEFMLAYDRVGEGQGWLALSWAHFFQPVQWESGQVDARPWTIFISVSVRALVGRYLARGSESLIVLLVLSVVALLAVEFVSFILGISIARSITRSIDSIYRGAESIQRGEFDFRIPAQSKDQLGAMAESFNEMSASIVGLMEQVSEREALEKELEIAKEVQTQLFPQELPAIKSLEIAASCTPARQVSGDYYDFLPHGNSQVDIVLGDISGKGISAALLMASTQAAIRSGLEDHGTSSPQSRRMAEVVREVNRQLYRRSSPELYSTLVLSHYDAETRTLSYCNAGHHPPLVFSNGIVKGLTVGGTVVGLFENWDFEGSQTVLNPGSVVLYFTDGVVEAANRKGEHFGTERVIELVKNNSFLTAEDIQSLIIDQVFDWSEDQEQADDITVVCLRVAND